MRRHFLALGTLALLSTSACTNLSELARTAPAGSDFNTLLANEYLAYSTAKSEQYDWYDSEYFAKKGLRAAAGISVQPENPNDWSISGKDYDRVARERRRIVALANGPHRVKYASEIAHAQVLYDCWLEQLDDRWLGEGDPVCADKFEREVADIESQILLAQPAVPSEKKSKSLTSVESEHTIFFGFDVADLGERGKAVIRDVTTMIKRMAGYSINVDGYADTSGPEIYNQMLSKKRADNVADALIREGADADKITTRGHGETNLLVETADDVIEKKNRRVEIRVHGKRDESDSKVMPSEEGASSPSTEDAEPKMQNRVDVEQAPSTDKEVSIVDSSEPKVASLSKESL